MPTPRPRPSGAGRAAEAATFLRPTTAPRAALVLSADLAPPTDWPIVTDIGADDAALGHALGWVCELRGADLVLLNPLGEGVLKAPLPPIAEVWASEVRATHGAAIYLLERGLGGDDPAQAVNRAARDRGLPAATVRTAFAESYGRRDPVARNAPCPCGSGRKYKQCHGR